MKTRLALLGEVLVDLIVSEDFTIRPVPGGSLYNTADSLSKLGVPVGFFSRVGNDLWGNYLLSHMESGGIGHTGVVRSDTNKTPLAFATIDKDSNAHYDFYSSPFTEKIDMGDFSEVSIFHFGSIFSILPENQTVVTEAILGARQKGCIVSYDPNFRPDFSRFSQASLANMMRADVIKASYEDLAHLLGIASLDEAFSVLDRYPATLVIVTLGEKGVAAEVKGRKPVVLEAAPVKVVDTIGAGDNFSAGYLCYLSAHGIATPSQLAGVDDVFVARMLSFAGAVAAEALKVKGACVPAEKLRQVKTSMQ